MSGDGSIANSVANTIDRLEGLSLKAYHRIKGPKKRYQRPPYNQIPQYRDYDPRLPRHRPRALTLPILSSTTTHKKKPPQNTDPQLDNLLMRLPAEIRISIYEAVLGHRRVHILFRSGPERAEHESIVRGEYRIRERWEWSWWNTICTWDHNEDAAYKNIMTDDICGYAKHFDWSKQHWAPTTTAGMQKLEFAILLTCRKIYSEAIDLLYRTTTFVFNDPNLFRIFPHFLLPRRFEAITSIEGVWRMPAPTRYEVPTDSGFTRFWNQMFTILANMPSLNHLKIVLPEYQCPRPAPDNLQQMWLGPLEKLRGKNLKVFEVWIPEGYAMHFKVDERSHFKLNTITDIMIGMMDNANSRFHYLNGSGGCGPVGFWLGNFPLPFPQS
ncbi:hypothetical protein N431DRAFT_459958 [Stipitochalara longipes BDJ]|nr:hypothetical protein N431DRAFT_459958 [Stipitochalara longipes BDJ]